LLTRTKEIVSNPAFLSGGRERDEIEAVSLNYPSCSKIDIEFYHSSDLKSDKSTAPRVEK
jgi:hypothetical protein